MSKISSILIIDDDSIHNYLSEFLMKEMDIADMMIFKDNAISAIEFLQSEPEVFPELILVDLKMPVMGGIEFAEKFTSMNLVDRNSITLALTTVSLIPPKVEDKIRTLIDDVIFKPFDEDKIQNLVNRHLQKLKTTKV